MEANTTAKPNMQERLEAERAANRKHMQAAVAEILADMRRLQAANPGLKTRGDRYHSARVAGWMGR